MKRWIILFLGLAISLAAIYFLLRGDIESLQDEFGDAHYEYLVVVIPLQFLGLATRGIRWRVLLGNRTSFWHSFHIMNVGYLLITLPLRLGEFARAWMTTRLDPPIAFFTSLSTIVVERVLDVLSVIFMLGVALLLLDDVPEDVSRSGAIVGLVAVVMMALLMYFARHREKAHQFLNFFLTWLPFLKRLNLVNWMDHFLDGLEPITTWEIGSRAIFWTAVSWLLSIILGYFGMRIFFDHASVPAIMMMIVFLALAIAVPSVPGNLGTFEVAGVSGLWVAGAISSMDAPGNAPAIALSVLMHVTGLATYIILGTIGLWAEQTTLGQVREGVNRMSKKSEGDVQTQAAVEL